MSYNLDLSDYCFVINFRLSIFGENTTGGAVIPTGSHLNAHNVHFPQYWWF